MTRFDRNIMQGCFVLAAVLVAVPFADAAPVVVAVAKLEAAPGAEVTVPLVLKSVKQAKGVRGLSIRLTYDPAILTFKSLEPGAALPSRTITQKSIDEKGDPGKLGLTFLCDTKTPTSQEFGFVEEDGVVLQVVFTVNIDAKSDQKSPLSLDNYRVLDTRTPPFEMMVTTENGEVAVVASPALPFNWMWIAIGGGVLLLLLLLALLMRRRNDPTPTPGNAPVASGLPRFTPEAVTFPYTCVKCGGVIQLPRSMAGQSFQCGACGTAQVANPKG